MEAGAGREAFRSKPVIEKEVEMIELSAFREGSAEIDEPNIGPSANIRNMEILRSGRDGRVEKVAKLLRLGVVLEV